MKKILIYTFLKFLSVCVVSITAVSGLYAQNKHLDCLRQIGIPEGLSHSTVTSIFRDSKGFLWVGTRHGLNLFDRNKIRHFYCTYGDDNSLPGNLINSINEDYKGNIWVGTDRGLVRYSHELASFERINDDNIRCAVRCGTSLVFGGSGYAYLLNLDTGDFSCRLMRPENPLRDEINGIVIKYLCTDADNSLIVAATNGRIYHFCLSDMTITRCDNLSFMIISDIIKTSDGQLFISSFKDGLFRYDESGHMTGHWTKDNSGLSSNMVTDFLESDGYLYCATDGDGICVMNLKTGTFQKSYLMNGSSMSLPTNSLTVLYKDSSGAFWAGTVRDGLLNLALTAIHSYQSVPADRYGYSWGLSERCVTSFYEDDGILWIGTDGGGMNRFNPDTHKFRHLPELAGKSVFSITEKDDATLIVSVYNDGVYEYSKQTGKMHRFLIIDEERDDAEQMSGVIPLLHKVSDRKILIFGRGIISYDPYEGSFREISETVDGNKIPFGPVLLYSDSDFSYFVSAEDTTVYRISLSDNMVDRIITSESSGRINAFCPGQNGKFYVGTDKGLFSYSDNGGKDRIGKFTSVSYLNCDLNGTLWICSENHLYSMKNDIFIPWTESEGFTANDIFGSGQCPPEGDRLYLCGSNGLTEIEYERLEAGDEIPELNLLNISVNGMIVPYEDRYKQIIIPFNSQLMLDLSVTEKDLFRETKFKYTIIHNGNRQTIIDDNTRLTMSMLSEGMYDIRASCLKRNGEWTSDYHLADILISPPWYRSTLAKTSYFIGIVSLILLVAEYLRRKEKRTAIASRNKYERIMQTRRMQNLVSMCHEIKTPLSLMYMHLKRLINKPDTGNEERLKDIFYQTCHINDIINMVLEYDNYRTGNFTMSLSIYDFNQWLEKQIILFVRGFEEKGVKIEFSKSDELTRVQFDERIIRIVFSNVLSYLLKHSIQGTIVKVTPILSDHTLSVRIVNQSVKLTESERNTLLSGMDSYGSGECENNISFSFCRELMLIHQGTIDISDDSDTGTIFTLSIPFVTDINQNLSEIADYSIESSKPELSEEQIEFCSHFSLMIIGNNQEFVNGLRSSILFCFKNVYISSGGDSGFSDILELKPDVIIVNYQFLHFGYYSDMQTDKGK